jgi:SAM-dependent methyltransferase
MSDDADVRCPVCGDRSPEEFLTVAGIPALCNVPHASQTAARQAPRGDLRLGFCQRCGHIFNRAFDPRLVPYTAAYENPLDYSPRFQAYAEELAQRLVARFELRDKDLLEIACGKGAFLKRLCELGGNRGTGFDPSFEPDRAEPARATPDRPAPDDTAANPPAAVRFIRDYYHPKYADLRADFICCRHALEHMPEPVRFLNQLRRGAAAPPGTGLFFEVPYALYTFKDMGVWDLLYEHTSYFTARSLAQAFATAGFAVRDLSVAYGGQFLGCEAETPRAGSTAAETALPAGEEMDWLRGRIGAFARDYRQRLELWGNRLAAWAGQQRRIVVWGGGSKGVMFLNLVPSRDLIAYVVDINPHKQGKYVPGSGQRFVPPRFLIDYRPHVIVVMNPLYRSEIAAQATSLGIEAELVSA